MSDQQEFSKFAEKLEVIANAFSRVYIRLFGSAVKSLSQARDVDLLVGRSKFSIEDRANLLADLEQLFTKPIDLIIPDRQVPSLLVREIGSTSMPLWEKPEMGRESYAKWICPRLAVAEDERLGFSVEMQNQSVKATQARLNRAVKGKQND